jgi:hypothetical protein
LGTRQAAFFFAVAVLGAFALLLALHADPAAACKRDSPCVSPVEKVLCPEKAKGSTGTGVATFNVPKGTRRRSWVIKDATTGKTYAFSENEFPEGSICAGTKLETKSEVIPGATEDTYKVTYTLTSDGSADPLEQHDVVVEANWELESDLEVEKHLLAGEGSIDAEEERTFAITIRNHGPNPTNGFSLGDAVTDSKRQILRAIAGVEQVAGPKAAKLDVGPEGTVAGEWGEVQSGAEITVLVRVRVDKAAAADYNFADVEHNRHSGRLDPGDEQGRGDLHANEDIVKFEVKPAPDSKIGGAGAGGASGSATPPREPLEVLRPALVGFETLLARPKVKKVQVAILRLGGGKALQGGLPETPTRKAGGCKWLANAGGRTFKGRKRSTKGVCDSPVWINAAGTSRWSLHLAHSLPPGKYVVYSRAVGSNGVPEGEFSAKDGNRQPIFVH